MPYMILLLRDQKCRRRGFITWNLVQDLKLFFASKVEYVREEPSLYNLRIPYRKNDIRNLNSKIKRRNIFLTNHIHIFLYFFWANSLYIKKCTIQQWCNEREGGYCIKKCIFFLLKKGRYLYKKNGKEKNISKMSI